ncbi:MAG TPA: ABC transporter permease [Mycobacteriales bacterium]|nr:ABC transporter permease [Mycobacteriales bacterium]
MSLLTPRRPAGDDEFVGEVHVYQPHSVGLPNLRVYLRELWRRREFMHEMARTDLRAAHFKTAFGMLWLVLNPLLLGLTYYLLVYVIRGGHREQGFMAHLLGALFAYHFFQQSVRASCNSVTGGRRLLMNSSFPRTMLPIASILTGIMKFVPTLAIYAVVHVINDQPINANLLWAIPAFALLIVFTAGISMLFATMQVYFRDTRAFLPYLLRILLYLTPILWTVSDLNERSGGELAKRVIRLNPLFDIIGAWSQALAGGRPQVSMLVQGAAWAAGALVVGGLVFISREREFAVRL